MRYEERALLSRSNYQNFIDNYTTPKSNFIQRTLISLTAVAFLLVLLFLLALISGSIALSSAIPAAVFLLVAYSLGRNA
jgi:hypothetical protein